MSITSVRLLPEIEQELAKMTVSMQRSKSWLINQALKEFIERQELEEERWKQTLQAMDSAAQGYVVEGDSVKQWLKSWGTDSELSPPGSKE